MACSTKAGPAAYLAFIEETTGEKIKQTEWHQIRELAAQHEGGVSRRRVSEQEALDAANSLASRLFSDNGYGLGDSDADARFDDRVDALHDKLAKTNNTEGTIAIINYLAEKGPLEVLATLREPDGKPSATSGVDWAVVQQARDEAEPMPDGAVLDAYEKETDPNRKQGFREEAYDRGLVDSAGERFDSPTYTPKFVTEKDDPTINIVGTGRVGDIRDLSYSDLYNTFGEPSPVGDGKSQVEWVLEFETPKGRVVASIYDWKEGDTEPQFIRNWNVGGVDETALEYVLKTLGRRY